jgi:peptidyl-tRNA hydrolase, PTH1 family
VLVVGLGNPGGRYAQTRHNIGFMAAEAVAPHATFKERFLGRVAEFELDGAKHFVLEPQTFMNLSGQSVQPAAAYYRLAPKDVVVIHDELDLPFGRLKLKFGGGEAGHNGLRSISQHLGTKDYFRVRMGIGRPPEQFAGKGRDFVLDAFAPDEVRLLPGFIEQAVLAVRRLIQDGAEAAMNETNKKSE